MDFLFSYVTESFKVHKTIQNMKLSQFSFTLSSF